MQQMCKSHAVRWCLSSLSLLGSGRLVCFLHFCSEPGFLPRVTLLMGNLELNSSLELNSASPALVLPGRLLPSLSAQSSNVALESPSARVSLGGHYWCQLMSGFSQGSSDQSLQTKCSVSSTAILPALSTVPWLLYYASWLISKSLSPWLAPFPFYHSPFLSALPFLPSVSPFPPCFSLPPSLNLPSLFLLSQSLVLFLFLFVKNYC